MDTNTPQPNIPNPHDVNKDWFMRHKWFFAVITLVILGAGLIVQLKIEYWRRNIVVDLPVHVEKQVQPGLNFDLMPLYPDLEWTDPATKEYDEYSTYDTGAAVPEKLTGQEVRAESDMVPQGLADYYDAKLKSAGWETDDNAAADGGSGSRWGYVKDDKHIIFLYIRSADGIYDVTIFSES